MLKLRQTARTLLKTRLYTQTKKTVNAENIPGMCVLTNRARKRMGFSVTESSWFSNCFERPQDLIFIFILQELKLLFLSI